MSDGKKDVSVIIKALDQTLPGFKEARGHVKDFAHEAKNLIAEAFAGFTVFEFFKTAVEKATEAEQSYVQLSNTLANVGVSYEHNRGQIDETIKSLQKVANVRTDDAIKGLNTLVQRSGDYEGALKNQVLTADLAKAKHLEYNEAAELVGRVMGGNTRVLKQFGIVTRDAHEGLEMLRQRLSGAAAADMATFGGQVEATKIKFFNLAEAVGDVITGSSTLGGTISDVRDWLGQLTKKIEENRPELIFWFSASIAGALELGRQLKDLVTVAFNFGRMWGDLGRALWYGWKSDEGKAAMADLHAAVDTGNAAIADMGKGGERLATAFATATEREEAAIHESGARLAANAARNQAERDSKAAAEQAKKDAEAKKQQDAQDRAVQQRMQVAEKLAAVHGTEAVGLAQLRLIEHAATEALKDGNLTWERRVVLLERANAAHAARVKLGDTELPENTALEQMNRKLDRDRANAANPNTAVTKIDVDADLKNTITGITDQARHGTFIDPSKTPAVSFMDALTAKWDAHRKKMEETGEAYKTFGQTLADIVDGPIAKFGESTLMAMGAMIVGAKNAGAAFRASLMQALAGIAKMEGDYFVAKAIAATGDAALGNPFAIFGQGQYMLAAAAMYAVSGGASALASGGGGGGGSFAQNASTGSSQIAAAAQGTTKVYITGKKLLLDLADAGDRQMIADMVKSLAGTREVEFVFAGES